MRTSKIIFALLAGMISMHAQSSYVRLTCSVEDSADSKPKAMKVVFEDTDRSWVIANGSRHPHVDYSGTTELVGFDDAKIEWCETPSKAKESDPTPARICYAINRATGVLLVTNQRTEKTKEGQCLVGRAQERKPF